MKPIDRMKQKLEQMRKQRQVHDDAASKYKMPLQNKEKKQMLIKIKQQQKE